MAGLSLEVYGLQGDDEGQFIIHDPEDLRWSTHYGESGGGYGYLRFTLRREIGHDYCDIGYGYRVILRKYLDTILFDGQVRQIEESSSPDEDVINVTALGWAVVAEDDELLRAFCDKRLSMWKADGEVPKGDYRPDLYSGGSNALGLFMYANNGALVETGQYGMLKYDFFPGETAERIKFDLSNTLGNGVIFEADIDRVDVDNGYVYYKNDSGEGNVAADMILYNSILGKNATISAIDPANNYITVESATLVGGWKQDEEIVVLGPLFRAQIDSIAAAVISYTNDIGEGNIVNDWNLTNVTKKSIATVQAHDDGANTITVSDADHIDGWEEADIIIQGAQLFYAQMDGNAVPADPTITYKNELGERFVKVDTGWILYNETQDEYATVSSWDVGNSQLDVTDANDVNGWADDDIMRIYTPLRLAVYDSDDVLVWPSSDLREGGIPHSRTAVNATTVGNPTGLKIGITTVVDGEYGETSFFQLENLRVYSTESDVTAEMLAKYAVSILSASGHDWDDSEDDIEAITKVLEPMVFEFSTFKDALSWACAFGDGSGDSVAWGIRLNDLKRFYLETQDLETIDYIVKRTAPIEASLQGDVQESWQQVRGVYSDKLGEQQITDWQSDTDAYFDAHFRRRSIRLENVTDSGEADDLVARFLSESKVVSRSARYVVHNGSVFSAAGKSVPIDEVQATGHLIMIEDWRSTESGESDTDLRNTWTTEQIVGVEIDYESRTATLIPASARSTFQQYMAELARLAAQ